MNKIQLIDSILQSVTDKNHRKLFDRWRQEYKQRYYFKFPKEPKPKPHSNYPGFERNLNALIFSKLQDKDPHSEWPYASCIEDSSEKVDIHIIDDGYEFWVELGMYATDERAKYSKDFYKLLSVVERSGNNIGVLVHFEIFEKNNVLDIFKELASQYSDRYYIDIRNFTIGDRTIACRLVISNSCAKQS